MHHTMKIYGGGITPLILCLYFVLDVSGQLHGLSALPRAKGHAVLTA